MSLLASFAMYPQVRRRIQLDVNGEKITSKACGFLCGAVFMQTPDPVNPDEFIRWCRLDGRGDGCYYCDRTYELEVAHDNIEEFGQHRDKAEFKKSLGTDSEYNSRWSKLARVSMRCSLLCALQWSMNRPISHSLELFRIMCLALRFHV